MIVKEVCSEKKKQICKDILNALPEWFGQADAIETYTENSANEEMFVAYIDDNPVGFVCLKETSKYTVEIAVMGVLKEFHRQKIGENLFLVAKKWAIKNEYEFMQVKTVQMGKYDVYDKTNKFYVTLGFRELEVFPTLWDKSNPCQIYVKCLI